MNCRSASIHTLLANLLICSETRLPLWGQTGFIWEISVEHEFSHQQTTIKFSFLYFTKCISLSHPVLGSICFYIFFYNAGHSGDLVFCSQQKMQSKCICGTKGNLLLLLYGVTDSAATGLWPFCGNQTLHINKYQHQAEEELTKLFSLLFQDRVLLLFRL